MTIQEKIREVLDLTPEQTKEKYFEYSKYNSAMSIKLDVIRRIINKEG